MITSQPRAFFRLRSTADLGVVFAIAMMTLVVGGCRGPEGRAVLPPPKAPLTRIGPETEARIQAPDKRMGLDMARAARKLLWGVRTVREDPKDGSITLDAQAPDERMVIVTARPQPNPTEAGTVYHVRVRVGIEGDPTLASDYIHTLEGFLQGPSPRQRGGRFRLPDDY